MLKKCLVVLVAAGALAIAAPFAAAQENQSNDQQAPPSTQENGGRHHGPPDPAKRTAELTKQLNLTSDQQTKVQGALQSEHSQMESVHQDTSLSQQDRRAKMMDIRQTTDSQIRALLDPSQQKKWDEMQAKHGQWGQRGHSGPPDANSNQQAPPPQST
jgi:periplasmic protein CpxP/Spy